MRQCKLLRRLFALLIGTALLTPLVATADDEVGGKDALPLSTLVVTEPLQKYSEKTGCVAPTSEMRRNHMRYILHQRDETVHEGIRTRKFSLEECINCHAIKDKQGKYVRIENEQHFCTTCHTYTSTTMDCFQCHSDVPVRASKQHRPHSGLIPQLSNEPFAGRLASETPTTEDPAQ